MAMVDTLLDNSALRKCVSCLIRPDNIFLDGEGVLDPAVIPELVAQAAAASDAHSHDGRLRAGFLALGRGIVVERDIHVQDEILITATDESPMDNWFVITFEIHLANGPRCAYGEISVCHF